MDEKLWKAVWVGENGGFLLDVVINQNKHSHEETNNKGALSSHGSDIITFFRGNGERVLKLILSEGYFHLKLVVIQVIVQLNFFFDLFFHTYQTDLLISLGIPLHSHHNILTCVLGQVLEDGVFGEVNVLVAGLVAVVWGDLNWQDQLLELSDKFLEVRVLRTCDVDQLFAQVQGLDGFGQLLLVDVLLVFLGLVLTRTAVVLDLLDDVEHVQDLSDFLAVFLVLGLLLLYELLDSVHVELVQQVSG